MHWHAGTASTPSAGERSICWHLLAERLWRWGVCDLVCAADAIANWQLQLCMHN
jgi:hypothetical protein